MDLTSSQQEALNAIVNGYEATESPVTAEAIAAEVDRHPGSIRDQMQVLKSVGVVESVMGPTGGYQPTEAAYEALGRRRLDETETLTLAHGYERIDATVADIDLTNVHHPERCRARVRFQQSIGRFSAGDPVVVGPTPSAGLVLAGQVTAIDEAANELHVEVARMEAPVEVGRA